MHFYFIIADYFFVFYTCRITVKTSSFYQRRFSVCCESCKQIFMMRLYSLTKKETKSCERWSIRFFALTAKKFGISFASSVFKFFLDRFCSLSHGSFAFLSFFTLFSRFTPVVRVMNRHSTIKCNLTVKQFVVWSMLKGKYDKDGHCHKMYKNAKLFS